MKYVQHYANVLSRWASVARSVPSKYHKKYKRSGVFATFCERTFEVDEPVIPLLYATYLPLISIGTSLELHWNFIGISPSDERIIKQLSPRLEQLFFLTKP